MEVDISLKRRFKLSGHLAWGERLPSWTPEREVERLERR